MKPLVFVTMPFGKKPDPLRRCTIDFDEIYERGIEAAITRFDVDYIRADEERSGEMIHKLTFERLLLAEIAVVDVTLSNPNVYYELGVRHATRPRSTIVVGSSDVPLPFNIAMVHSVPYTLTDGKLEEPAARAFADALATRIEHALTEFRTSDSPLFQLIPNLAGQKLPHDITDAFREKARELDAFRRRLDDAKRSAGQDRAVAIADVDTIAAGLGKVTEANFELFLEIFLAYRDLEEYSRMVALAESVPDAIYEKVPMLREQHAFALNRRFGQTKDPDDRARAIAILEGAIEEVGHTPETSSLLARIYKDQFLEALTAGERIEGHGYLAKAIDLYRQGFNADPRDYYPGINLCTLLALNGSNEARAELKRTLPAVSFAVSRLGGVKSADYWQVATVLELAALGSDSENALRALAIAVALDVPDWYFKSTANNLMLLRHTEDGVLDKTLLEELHGELLKRATRPSTARA